MKLSIITINYNNASGLKSTIESVVNQTYKDYEYIIIDGGSTDGSVEIIKQYADKITYWVSEKDRGIYHAMNKGIAIAKGDYCNFMNSGDCYNSPDVLENTFKLAKNTDFIVGKSQRFHVKNKHVILEDILINPSVIERNYMLGHCLPHQATFIKTILLKSNNYDETLKIASDWKQMLEELTLNGKSYSNVDVVVGNFDTNGISSNAIECTKERSKVLSLLLDDIFGNPDLRKYRVDSFFYCYSALILATSREFYSIDNDKKLKSYVPSVFSITRETSLKSIVWLILIKIFGMKNCTRIRLSLHFTM